MNDQIIFATLVSTPGERSSARLLIQSMRTFGGPLSKSPFWIFTPKEENDLEETYDGLNVIVHPLTLKDTVKQNWFAGKVTACARAEELAGSDVHSLVWISSGCLIIQHPVLYELGSSFDAAFRPVHIRNIGLPASEPLDDFWKRVYHAAGVDDVQATVESFVDDQRLRAYYNSHAFIVNPSVGLMQQWYEIFETLVSDRDFQSGTCQDELHQIFLHQAVLSTLVATRLDPEKIRILPPEYNYPYNLQGQIPVHKRAAGMNELVSIAYEDRSLNPDDVKDIDIHDPLRSWLFKHIDRSESG